MLFLCCDPELAPQSQMVLALKTLCGFNTQEIALRLFLSPSAVQKRLSRARNVLRARWSNSSKKDPGWSNLSKEDLVSRTPAVLRLIYLLFNEGYSSIRGDAPLRRELCHEAIFLGQSILDALTPSSSEALALQSLMLLHLARFDARLNPAGEVILLEAQDRSLWDQELVQQGVRLFFQSTQDEVFSRFHGEAAIAVQHCIAPSFAQTNWQEIADLYGLLAKLTSSPIYRLNQAIAIAQARGPSDGLAQLNSVHVPQWLENYYLWHATKGELHRQAEEFAMARDALSKALERAPSDWERALIQARLKACPPNPGES